MDNTRSPAIKRMQAQARKLGYSVEFAQFTSLAGMVEHLPGTIGGFCDYEAKRIVVSTHKSFTTQRSRREVEAILAHELEHAGGAKVASDNPEFGLRCGNRPCSDSAEHEPA